ncbi:MAG: hypothetical protein ABI210_03420, partial [Abditibacteriaceae bacterium]
MEPFVAAALFPEDLFALLNLIPKHIMNLSQTSGSLMIEFAYLFGAKTWNWLALKDPETRKYL